MEKRLVRNFSLDHKRTVPNKGTVSQVCGYLRVSSDKTLNFDFQKGHPPTIGMIERQH